MAVRRPLIIDGGLIKELPSGDSLPAPAKTAATLTHTDGAITLDVQAADVFRFEADEYTPAVADFDGAAFYTGTMSAAADIPGTPEENDIVILYGRAAAGVPTTPAGYTEIHSASDVKAGVFFKQMGSTPDTTIDLTGLGLQKAVVCLIKGVDATIPQDATAIEAQDFSGASTAADPGAITTVTDGALVVLFMHYFTTGKDGNTVSGYVMEIDEESSQQYTVASKSIASAGAEDPGTWLSSAQFWWIVTTAWRPGAASGETDYTFTFSNIPSSGVAEGLIDLELKTDTGSVAFAGGTVTWRGTEPAFDAIGHYLLGFAADTSGITLWREA